VTRSQSKVGHTGYLTIATSRKLFVYSIEFCQRIQA
jgi:hypothetical protein